MESGEIKLDGLVFEPFLDQQTISKRIQILAEELNQYYHQQHIQLVVMLQGAQNFYEDLFPLLTFSFSTHFIKIKTYQGLHSVQPIEIPETALKSWNSELPTLIVEDIIDTGRTLWSFMEYLKQKNGRDIHIVSLLVKPEAMQLPVKCRFRGFDIGTEFVVGFGMDYNDSGRDLDSIFRLKSHNIP